MAVWAVDAQETTSGWETTTTFAADTGIAAPTALRIKDTMNFVDCVQPKRSGCVLKCGGVGVRAKYREPVVTVEVSCRVGESALMKGDPVAMAVGKVLTTAATGAVGGGETKCQVEQSGGGGKSTQTQYFFNAHAFGVTFGAMAQAAAGNSKKINAARDIFICEIIKMMGTKAKGWESQFNNIMNNMENNMTSAPFASAMGAADDVVGTISSVGRTCGANIVTANLKASVLPFGLIPLFISELCMPATWAMQNPTNIKDNMRVAANLATIGTSDIACAVGGMLDDLTEGFGNFTGLDVDGLTLDVGDNLPCVGTWGNRSPTTGWHSNKIKPISAAMVGYRAYQEVANLVPKYKNRKGTLKFNMDYPFINGGGVLPSMNVNPFARNHGHKGSGCYNVGTMDPRWYTKGESFLPTDISQIFNDIIKDAKDTGAALTGQSVKTDNGDYVFTFWRNNSCCYGVCPFPKPRLRAYKEFD